jgi:hypothetical protein
LKESVKYLATLFAFIGVAFILSWCSVYSFWIGARVFGSVTAIRAGDAIGSVILLPARLLFDLAGSLVSQTTLLTNPVLYATINASLLGIIAYACCRRFLFREKKGE